jgi:hypothetical protein
VLVVVQLAFGFLRKRGRLGVEVMLMSRWVPYGLILVWTICAGILAWAIAYNVTGVVQATYAILIIVLILIIIISIISAIMVFAGHVDLY